MKYTIVKDSFGPYRISCSRTFDSKAKNDKGVNLVEHYVTQGLLHELERKPSTEAEKPYWPYVDAKGKPAREDRNGNKFTRSMIPVSEKVRAEIAAVIEAHGFEDVVVTMRETSEQGPAWKTKVAALVGMPELDEDITPEQVKGMLAKLIAKLGLDSAEVMAYAASKGLK